MPLAFLSPLLLGAAALVAVPWILHHIRRPEREPVPFSSLLFIPDVKREVIERRRLQHLLLLLLRMLVLLLIACALARPYVPLLAGAAEREGGMRHVILLDTSYSMGAEGVFDTAKAAARKVIDGLDGEDRAAVVTFDETVRVLTPFTDKAEARLAIESASLTLAPTDYEGALRTAARLLSEEGLQLENGAQTVHLVSDFQRAGMPKEHSGWKLPSAISFSPVDVGAPEGGWAVQDVDLRVFGEGRFELRAKVKNWSAEPLPATELRWVLNGEELQRETLGIAPGNASLLRFDFDGDRDRLLEGYVEVLTDGASPAARRYFAWNPKRKTRVLIAAAETDARRWPPPVLLAHALPDTAGSPWSVTVATELEDGALDNNVVPIIAQSGGLAASEAADVLRYIEAGGSALIALDAAPLDETLRTELLAPLGVTAEGTRFGELRENRFVLLSWIDYDDPVFHPFQGARFNDFSDIHFKNHHVLRPDPMHRVTARFESGDSSEGPPAIIEVTYGEGRAIIWAFPIDFSWTNFPKTARFVPLLHETLDALCAGVERNRTWEIGARPTPPETDWRADLAEPGESSKGFDGPLLTRTGHLHWHDPADPAVLQSEAVNVNAEEADPTRVAPAEFALRLCSAPIITETPADAEALMLAGENPVDTWEYGRYLLAAVLAALALETWYAARLT